MSREGESDTTGNTAQGTRQLPSTITIPPIRGEMVRLRPAQVEDLPRLDELDAYHGASRITGKDRVAERALVHAWVRRSVAWAQGVSAQESGVGDAEARRTIAWAMLADVEGAGEEVIGMIFLIDIDGWARSARIQVVLGHEFRGRGYSRDAMPRVMTYGFAPEPAGLGMHRIWVAVPEKNSRSISVYQSLGFVPSGTSRDALWDAENCKYQDLIVMDTLADEYDPIRSLDAFGMHVLEDNPGVQEALSMREHSIALHKAAHPKPRTQALDAALERVNRQADETISDSQILDESSSTQSVEEGSKQEQESATAGSGHEENASWPYMSDDRKQSKNAWWRNISRTRKRNTEGGK